ncbi:MAG: histidine kinase [Treponema sp.]|nr:histidine kinase [Treponema sp.]
MELDYLFKREQKILDDVNNHLKNLKSSENASRQMFELLAKEYGIILKHLRKVVGISDRADGIILKEQELRLEKINNLENQLLQNQISIMLSQIQPHFLYNSLTVIRYLCRTDPQMAEETINEFSDYLRGNFESLAHCKLISFEKELRHVKTYLAIEQKRFPNSLNIVYNINTVNFYLPALSLQPIAENAVRHGIGKKEGGGTVTISTGECENCFVIKVKDDGPGFEETKKKIFNIEKEEEERIQIGIQNVRTRLYIMCGGSLEMQSNPGEGTLAVISIPKKIAPSDSLEVPIDRVIQ